MLQIEIPLTYEGWDEEKQEFVEAKTQVLRLEHSLISLSKWESKWCTPFFSKKGMTREETIDYIKCMTITQNVKDEVYERITNSIIERVTAYINAPMTARYFSDNKKGKGSRDIVTSDDIYYWLVAAGIPFECEKWHLNRLITLVRICSAKNQSPNKRNQKDILSEYAALNAARRKQFNSRG